MHRYLFLAFGLSGAAGLIYEAVWGRYLALFVGHSAYAQVLVIGTYLGGMAVGAFWVGKRAERIGKPLLWYVGAEVGLAAAGLLFHPFFKGVTWLAFDQLIPILSSAGLMTGVKWTLAVGILLPQSILLGTTFPLMSSGFIRTFPGSPGVPGSPGGPGRTLSLLYFTNSLGAAVGVLVGGFFLVGAFGLPGALVSAALLNVMAAGLTYLVVRHRRGGEEWTGVERGGRPEGVPGDRGLGLDAGKRRFLLTLLLSVSFATAVASFAYEIGWIRMLSLVMGSATHSFEVMLSAFILGLALGAYLIRRRADGGLETLSALGWIQWFMGLSALATLPLYASTFETMAYLVEALPPTDTGYGLFGVARYGIAIAIMLPSTIMAGMTLPLITATLLKAGIGEGSIGWVYGSNTVGSVLGVALAGLVALPLLGLKGLILAGAAMDMILGVLILALRGRMGAPRRAPWAPGFAFAGTLLICVLVQAGVRLDQRLLISGVFRYGALPQEGESVLFYRDGRTATVGVHMREEGDLAVLTTNGKPDASISLRWIRAQTETLPPRPIAFDDEATQTLLALIPLAHNPLATRAAEIGHGSGLTGQAVLASPHLQRSVTIEIEEEMIAASEAFYPANARVFDDPRSTLVIDDAKTFFASGRETFDLIISEPSNPWVSGVSNLFTVEFYDRVSRYLSPGGLFAQWFHCYEMNDALAATVLASLHQVFPHYLGYQVGPGDLLIIASRDEPISPPDWSVFQYPDVARMLAHVPTLTPRHLDALRLFDSATLGPFLEGWTQVNSDYFPVLDLEAERARFKGETARGFLDLGNERILLDPFVHGEPRGFLEGWTEPVLAVGPFRSLSIGAWVRWARHGASLSPEPPSPAHERALEAYEAFSRQVGSRLPPADWRQFMFLVAGVERVIHRGTAGVADTLFYTELNGYLASQNPPGEALAAADFLLGMASWDHDGVVAATPTLMEAWGREEEWVPRSLLLEGGILAHLASGRVKEARELLEILDPTPGERSEGSVPDLRVEILRGLVARGALRTAGST